MDIRVTGRSYLVTGASGGLGYAVASALTEAGARVTISARNADSLESARAKLGENAASFCADNADPSAAANAVAAALEQGDGRLDGLLVSVSGLPPSTVTCTPGVG